MPPTKTAQDAEAAARIAAGVAPGEGVDAASLEASLPYDAGEPGAPPQQQQQQQQDAQPQQREMPKPLSPFDSRRNDIVARFRTDRQEQAEQDRDEVSDFIQNNGMPLDFERAAGIDQPEPEPAPDADADTDADTGDAAPAAAAPAAAPQKVKIKVHGEEREVALDDLIAKAQIAYASDNILDAAKTRLKEIDDLLAVTRNQVPRADQPGQHQPDANATQAADADPGQDAAAQHQGDEQLRQLIETLQFGDPAEASRLLEDTIQQRAQAAVSPAVEASLRNQRLRDEAARTAKVLTDFRAQNPELAEDKMASAAMEARVMDLQVEDLKALGIDPSKIPTPTGVVTPGDIATAHRFYRAEGFSVRSPATMLETAKNDVLQWMGKNEGKAPDPAPKAEPRVDLTVDRTQRRQAIPQQPSRTGTPKPDAQQQRPAQARDRSDIVAGMIAARNKPRNRVVV